MTSEERHHIRILELIAPDAGIEIIDLVDGELGLFRNNKLIEVSTLEDIDDKLHALLNPSEAAA